MAAVDSSSSSRNDVSHDGTGESRERTPLQEHVMFFDINGDGIIYPRETYQGTGDSDGELTPLKKHVIFFDGNRDGIIYPWETYQGFRKIGCGVPLSFIAAIFINLGLSRKTRPGKWPSLLFPIEVKNIKLAKHTSDSGVYDSEGRFVLSKFEEIFKKHARSSANGLTSKELDEFLKANREPKDYKGWIAALAEWKVLYLIAKDKDGVVSKEAIRGVYDGSLFQTLAEEHASKKKKKHV